MIQLKGALMLSVKIKPYNFSDKAFCGYAEMFPSPKGRPNEIVIMFLNIPINNLQYKANLESMVNEILALSDFPNTVDVPLSDEETLKQAMFICRLLASNGFKNSALFMFVKQETDKHGNPFLVCDMDQTSYPDWIHQFELGIEFRGHS